MARKQTRNAQGQGTIRQRSDGRWEARYTVGRDNGTGKQIQKSIYGKTQKEVLQKLQQINVDLNENTYIEPTKLTVGKWLDIWIDKYITHSVKPTTLYSYQAHIKNNIKPALGSIKLTSLSTHVIQGFYNNLLEGTGKRKALSPKTIKNAHGILHKALKQAMLLGYIRQNPSDACTLPRVAKPEIKPLQEKDISLFLDIIKGHPFETLYIVDIFTGMRQGEILGLTWDCIDFDKGTILLNKQLQRVRNKDSNKKYEFTTLKNDKARTITPAPSIIELLHKHRQEQRKMQLKAGSLWNNKDNLVFTNETGRHLTHTTVYKHFKRLVVQAGLSDTRFHDLRHSYAVAALQSGDNVKIVQENLGHHAAAFTLDVYGHVTDTMKTESANRMENFINQVQSAKG